MIHILHVLTTTHAVGAPRLVLDWLAEPGYEQGVLFFPPERAQLSEQFMRAWKTFKQAGQYELWIAGGGSIREELEALTLKLDLKSFRFLGAIENVPVLLWSSAIFAFSANLEEGFGTVLIEALAAGCNIVATDVPACREVLQGGKYGMLVPSQDADAMASAIPERLRAPKDSAKIAEGVEYAKSFAAVRMIRSYLGIAFDSIRRVAAPVAPPVVANGNVGHRRRE